ncbi:glycosyltransferase [Oscillospiraceae bacterium PP1C4]
MKSYLTLISSDNYLQGALVLNESLKRSHAKYKLTVLISANVSSKVENILNKMQIDVIRINKTVTIDSKLEKHNEEVGYKHWNNTFDCLLSFGLCQFDKLVFLDSDMLVLENIDELFDKPHMSAVKDPGTTTLNSGTVVIEPEEGLVEKLIEKIPAIMENHYYFGDQTVLQEYYKDWPDKPELHLDDKYNMFLGSLHWFIGVEGYHLNGKSKNIGVVHFVGGIKPWMIKTADLAGLYKTYTEQGNPYAIQMTNLYLEILEEQLAIINKLGLYV